MLQGAKRGACLSISALINHGSCDALTDDGARLRTGSVLGANFHPTAEVNLKETSRGQLCRRNLFYMETPGRACPTSSMLGRPLCGSTNAKVFTSNLRTWEWVAVFPGLSTGAELLMLSRGLGHLQRAEETEDVHPGQHRLHARCRDSPVVQQRPHRVSGGRGDEAVPHAQGKRGGRPSGGDLHVCSFPQRKGQRELVFGKEGREGRI